MRPSKDCDALFLNPDAADRLRRTVRKEDRAMTRKVMFVLAAAAILAPALASTEASAARRHWDWRYDRDIRSDRSDIFSDRIDRRRDRRDIVRDRADLARDLRFGAGPADIARDWADIRRDRRDLRGDFRDLRRDRRDLRWDRYDY
jgi:hypothetical protein